MSDRGNEIPSPEMQESQLEIEESKLKGEIAQIEGNNQLLRNILNQLKSQNKE